MTFTVFTGKGGDPASRVPWPNFPAFLAGQWGLIASPTWLEAVEGRSGRSRRSPSARVRSSSRATHRATASSSPSNPDYWMTDADGNQLPYLDRIEFRVIEDARDRGRSAAQRRDRHLLHLVGPRDRRLPGQRRGLRHRPPGRAHRDQLHPHRPVEGQRPRRSARALRDVDGHRPPGARRRHSGRDRRSPPTACSRQASRATWRTTASDGAGPRGRRRADRGVRDRDRQATSSSTSATPPSRVNDERAELLLGWWNEIGIDAQDQAVPAGPVHHQRAVRRSRRSRPTSGASTPA